MHGLQGQAMDWFMCSISQFQMELSRLLEVNITILNRPPRQIFDDSLETHTLTSLQMPLVFVDDDGIIVNMTWTFDEPVNLEGGLLTQLDPFTETESTSMSPAPAWRTPGLKTVNVSATDNDGNTTTVSLSVNVLNQRPVALLLGQVKVQCLHSIPSRAPRLIQMAMIQ